MYATESSRQYPPSASDARTIPRQIETWGDRFIKYHNANPKVYQALVNSSLKWLEAKGNVRVIGFGLMWELARADLSMEIIGSGEYKFNDAYRAFYARLIMEREPCLAGKYKLRKSEADDFMTPENIRRCK